MSGTETVFLLRKMLQTVVIPLNIKKLNKKLGRFEQTDASKHNMFCLITLHGAVRF